MEDSDDDFESRFKFRHYSEFPLPDPVTHRKHGKNTAEFTNYDENPDDSYGEGRRKILVSNIPPGVSAYELEWIFTNEKKQGGGEVVSLELNANDRTAIIEFKEIHAVDIVLNKRPITVNETELNVEEYDPWPQSPQFNTVQVSGIPRDVELGYLQFYFKDTEKSGGDKSATVKYNDGDTVAYITFETEEVAYRVTERQHKIFNKSIKVALYTGGQSEKYLEEQDTIDAAKDEKSKPKIPPRQLVQSLRETLQSRKKEVDRHLEPFERKPKDPDFDFGSDPASDYGEKSKTILVSNLPTRANKDYLEMFFENTKKQGGGPVKSVDMNEEEDAAIIEFFEPESAETVLSKTPINMYGVTVDVEVYEPEPQCTVIVSDLPELDHKEMELLEMYFENPRSGGDTVTNIKLDEEERLAYVTFESEEVAKSVVEKKHKLKGVPVRVSLQRRPFNRPCIEDVENDETNQDPESEPTNIIVYDLPAAADEEFLEMFFENTKKQGGGPVKSVDINKEERTAVVEFEESDAVGTVLKNRQIKILGEVVEIKAYVPEPQCTVRITGLAESASNDVLELYFDNEKKSGGGNVKDLHLDDTEGAAYVTFETEDVARRVANRSHKLFGTPINVNLHRRHEERRSRNDSEKVKDEMECSKVLVRNLPEAANEVGLKMYFEMRKNGGGPVKSVEINRSDKTAIVDFKNPEDAKRVTEKKGHKIGIKTLQVMPYDLKKGRTDFQAVPKDVKEDEQSMLNAVKVTNISNLGHSDTLQFYFENARKSGGGTIVNFEVHEEDDFALVTFQEEKVAKRVCSKSHSLNGVSLDVSSYQPPKPKPCYTDRLIFKGVAETTTTEGLQNFIEALSGKAPSLVVYGEKDETVMVTFDSEPDFESLTNSCKKRSLEGRKLMVSKVPISNCVVVSNMKPTTSEDTIRYYFENQRRSGGGEIEKLEVRPELGYCLVHFLDHSVIGAVLKKKHVLESQELVAQLYIDDLGIIHNDGSERRFKTPDPITIDDIGDRILEFIRKSDYSQTDLRKKLEGLSAKVQFPDNCKAIVIECTLASDVQECSKKAKGWSKTVEDVFNTYVTQLSKVDHPIGNEIWGRVIGNLKDMEIENSDQVMVFLDSTINVIKVAGYKEAVDNLSKKVKEIIKNVCDEVDRLKHTATETLKIFKPWQIRLLLEVAHEQEMKKHFPNLNIIIDEQNCSIAFEGKSVDVQAAKDKTYAVVNNKFSLKRIEGISRAFTDLFQTGPVRNEIQKRLAKQNLVALWETDAASLVIYSYEKTLSICAEIIFESLEQRNIQVQKEMQTALSSKKWQTLNKDIREKYGDQCFVQHNEDGKKIVVTGICDVVNIVVENIETFLTENSVVKEELPIANKNVIRLLETHYSDRIENIAQELRDHNVQIWYGKGKVAVQGTEKGIELAKKKMYELCQQVEIKQHKICRPGLVSHLSSQKGKESIQHVEKTYKVVTAIVEEGHEETSVGGDWSKSKRNVPSKTTEKGNFKMHSRCRMLHDRMLYTGEGNMALLDVDVIFNSVDRSLSLSGGLGRVLVKEGGDRIARECADYIKKKGTMRPGDVFVSSAGSLHAQYIVHIVSPEWSGGRKKEEKILSETVFKALREANKKNIKSIAIPAIGCGNYGFPLQNSTKAIANSINNFFREIQDSPIQTVYLQDVKPETVTAFTSAIEDVFQDVDIVAHSEDEDDDEMNYEFSVFKKSLSSKGAVQRRSGSFVPGKQNKDKTTNVGKTDIQVIQGEIANQQVDVIVNNTGKALNLRYGAVSASILKKGGVSVQQELKQKYPKGLGDDEIAVTSGGNMNCSFILHGCLMPWDGGAEASKALRKMVTSCLEWASNQKATSIAFPALGTGQLGFPGDVVAKEMFSAAEIFINEKPDSSVKNIKFVIYHKDMDSIKIFEAERKVWLASSSRKQKRKSKERGTPWRRQEESDDESDVVTIPTPAASGAIKITVRQGDITEAETCGIINSSDSNLSLSGAVAHALLKKCGNALKDEANAVVSQMQKTGIAMTSAPNLKCRFILHVDADRGWKQVVDSCLQLAQTESIDSLAFPALGTAKDLDAKSSAQLMMNSVREFAKSSDGTLENIEFVVYQDQMFEDFKTVVKSYKSVKPKSTSVMGAFWKTIKDTFGFDSSASGPKPGQEQTLEDTSTVHLVFYSLSTRSISDAIKGIEKFIDQDVTTQKVEDDCIKTFDKQQIDTLHSVAAMKEVELHITQATGRILITGISQNVLDFKDDINKLIREVERSQFQQKHADILTHMVQWFYIEITETGQELTKYDKQTNSIIEAAFQDQKPNARFHDKAGTQYIIDFDSMTEFPEKNELDQVKVIRRDLISDMKAATTQWNPPITWDPMGTDEFIKVVPLSSTSPEYQTIETRFNTTNTGNTILKIHRIQNKTLYMQYEAKKQLLEQQNPPGTTNERTLWHGTAPEAVDSINAHGFNRSYCGKNATFYGQGVYFAIDARYSCQDTYSRADPNGNKRVYLCKVLTGEFTTGSSAMRVPPLKPSGGPSAVYDSVVNDEKNPAMFITFNDTQAYPDYLVTCKKK